MGLDAAKLLAVAAIVLGLILRVGLLGATFGAPTIPAPARRGEGEREASSNTLASSKSPHRQPSLSSLLLG